MHIYGLIARIFLTPSDRALQKPKKERTKKEAAADESSTSSSSEEEEAESLSAQDAYMFPIYGSAVLFGLYLILSYLSAEYVNYLFSAYFSILGIAALTKIFVSIIRGISGFRPDGIRIVATRRRKREF